MMKKELITIPLMLGLLLGTGFLFNSKPVTELNHITLHSINNSEFGWDSNESVCSPIHFQTDYKQLHEVTYIKLGVFPLCFANESLYDHDISLFCNAELVTSWNITENCEAGGRYDYEWLEFNNENATAGLFQSDILTSVYSCMMCVNNSSTVPSSDFWIRVENIGNRVIVEYHNETVLPGLEPIEDGIVTLVEFTINVIQFGINVFTVTTLIWSIFGIPMFFLFMIRRFLDRAKATFPRRKR